MAGRIPPIHAICRCVSGRWEPAQGDGQERFVGIVEFQQIELGDEVARWQEEVLWVIPTPTHYLMAAPVPLVEVSSEDSSVRGSAGGDAASEPIPIGSSEDSSRAGGEEAAVAGAAVIESVGEDVTSSTEESERSESGSGGGSAPDITSSSSRISH